VLGIFGVLVLGLVIVQYFNIEKFGLFEIILGMADTTGLLLLFAMTRIYLLPTVPPWNNLFTPLQFIFSAMVPGAMLMVGFLLQNPENYPLAKTLIFITGITIFVEAGFAWFYNQYLKHIKGKHQQKPAHDAGVSYSIYVIRVFIMLVCVFFLTYLSITIHPESANHSAIIRFYSLIFGLVILQELAGRYLFYQSYFRIGV
jgi:anaerobic dimethyl sulfoxide reductase subunit C (anchor subunit)